MEAFSDIFEDCTSQGIKIPKEEYLSEGRNIIIDQGQNSIAGYTDLDEGLFEDVPAIIFGDHTRIIKYVDKPFFLGADGVKLLKSKKKDANYKYLYYALRNAKIPDTGYNRHFKWLKEVKIEYPNLEKQHSVVEVLDKITSIIDERKRELEAFDKLIKARFVEMFGDVIRNEKGWSQYIFDEITESRLGKMLDSKKQTGKYSFPYLANYNVQWFRFEIENLNQMDFDESDQKEFELREGDLLVCEGGEIGRCAVWHGEIQPCYFQKALHRVRCNKDVICPDYLAWWFKYNCDHGGFLAIEGAKATIAHLPGAKLKKLQVTVPPIENQKLFVEFLQQTDKSRVAVQKVLNETKLLFDSLMQQYFG